MQGCESISVKVEHPQNGHIFLRSIVVEAKTVTIFLSSIVERSKKATIFLSSIVERFKTVTVFLLLHHGWIQKGAIFYFSVAEDT